MVALFSSLFISLHAFANPGDLDTTFGGGKGWVTTAIGASTASAKSVIQQADGKLVAAGMSFNGSVTILCGPDGAIPQIVNGAVAKSRFGFAVALGDVNGDNRDDFLVGAPKDDDVANKLTDSGSVTVLSGSGFGQLQKFYGASAKANAGTSVASGDINNDGKADIIAGAAKDDKPAAKVIKDAGSVSVFSGNGYAPIGSTLYGNVAKDYFGTAVSAGDINSDGSDDLIIGIPGFDLPAAKPIKDAGKVTVLSGAGL